ncbi:MAG: hypothetical protein P4M11_15775 [Candidatus Pacebacteria bacterium]|nr:hypothetical protein [Candidatus Paceibacterota bacterium]
MPNMSRNFSLAFFSSGLFAINRLAFSSCISFLRVSGAVSDDISITSFLSRSLWWRTG